MDSSINLKIGIYSPYLDSFGGGERYVLTAAEVLSKHYRVDLLLDSHHLTLDPQKLKEDLAGYLDLDLSKVNLVKAPIGAGSSFLQRVIFFRKYDFLFYLTDGSIFYNTAKKGVIHFQVPFKNMAARSLWGQIKLSSWKEAVYNSQFTREHIEPQWKIGGRVIYPPVEVNKIQPLKKEKYILSVGRFASFSKSKKHEEMIKVFAGMHKNGKTDGWSLHLAGSVEGDGQYLNELKALAGTAPVSFYPNLPFADLLALYGHSSIYWHAAGFGEDDPARMEHFGITTVEAMAAGCVPVVINKGGQKEIVEDGVSGFLWDDLDQLQEITLKLIKDQKLLEEISKESIKRSKEFSRKRFEEDILKLAND